MQCEGASNLRRADHGFLAGLIARDHFRSCVHALVQRSKASTSRLTYVRLDIDNVGRSVEQMGLLHACVVVLESGIVDL